MIIVGIPVGDSHYVVIKNGKIVRETRTCGAQQAYTTLKPKRGERLYIEVGPK